MKNWDKTPFSKLLVDSKDGEWGESEEAVGSREAIVIRGTDFSDLNNPRAEFPQRWVKAHLVDRKRLQSGDIILETAGGTSSQATGRTALVTNSLLLRRPDIPILCSSFTRYLRLNTDLYSPRFIYYLLQSLYRSGYMAVFNIQHTGVSRFQYTSFKNHTELTIPDLPIQQKIAAVLLAYDEIIENCQRRIALLERIAEELYREWFVRFRFPGYKGAKFTKAFPAEWDIKRVKDIVVRKRFGRLYREDELSDDGQVVVIDQSRREFLGFYDGDAEHIATGERPFLLFGDHTCKMVLLTVPFSLAENVVPFEAKEGVLPHFLFHLLKDLAKTTEYKRHWSDLSNREVLVPKYEFQIAFETSVKQTHDQVQRLRGASGKATKIRDLLLQRLISGRISVEDVSIQYPPAMGEELEHQTSALCNA